jgi:hypothetical protein
MTEVRASEVQAGDIVVIHGRRADVLAPPTVQWEGTLDVRFRFEDEPALHHTWTVDEMVELVGNRGDEMSELMVPYSEHLAMVRRVGHLEGAIEAHRILIGSYGTPADNILWTMLDEGIKSTLGGDGE